MDLSVATEKSKSFEFLNWSSSSHLKAAPFPLPVPSKRVEILNQHWQEGLRWCASVTKTIPEVEVSFSYLWS